MVRVRISIPIFVLLLCLVSVWGWLVLLLVTFRGAVNLIPCSVGMPVAKNDMIVQQNSALSIENPGFKVLVQDQGACECVYCDSDKDCGGLWEGSVANVHEKDVPSFKKITLIIAHCLHDLSWVHGFTKGFNIDDIVIFSKCGHSVKGAPEGSRVVQLSNVGRNDHDYAHFINLIYDINNQDSEVFLFLKDDFLLSNKLQPNQMRSLRELLVISHEWGFACGRELGSNRGFELSTYHYTPLLKDFSLAGYKSKNERYIATSDDDGFRSKFKNFSEFMISLNYSFPKLTQVCYGGNFATTRQSIQRHPNSLWYNLEKSLSRANNLEEGHFAERSWAGLLANPIKRYQMKALLKYGNSVANFLSSSQGALQCPLHRLSKEMEEVSP